MAARETAEQQVVRWQELEKLQKAYPHFNDLLYDVMTDLMNFECTWLQEDIGDYLENGPLYRMIQAQRGQAKTTITAIYAVWRLIHDPSTRVLIISAGGAMASQISGWVIQIINGMEILACLRPDRSAGDRASVEAFDVHYVLKGPEKSPSVACLGATSNMQGFRADLLIADDIESKKNASTPVQREKLTDITRDFTSICSKGDIIYLGTPQSVDSIYNGLPSRGYDVRVWTGRFPTQEEMKNYGANIAPTILQMCQNYPALQAGGGPMGDRGQATDPIIVSEDKLTAKEVDQGPAYFQLQHMLDTALMDKDRYPLKPENLFFMDLRDADRAPLDLKLVKMQNHVLPFPAQFPIGLSYHAVPDIGSVWGAYMGTHMYVDPAGGGQNGDETAYAITRSAAGKIFVVACGGVKGGLGAEELQQLTDIAIKYKVNSIGIEKNFGNGALSSVWQPTLLSQMKEEGLTCSIEDVWESGQKELRIIDVLEPVIENSKLVVDIDLIDDDWDQCQKYPIQERSTYSLFWQMARITRDKNCLIHDDRLDALAAAVRYWVDLLALDEKKALVQAEQANYQKMIRNPLGMPNAPRSGMLSTNQSTPNRMGITRRF
jgi:hypothetical protein